MRTRYVVTGSKGHLGNTVIRMLKGTKAEVFGLVLPWEDCKDEDNVHYVKGDVRDIDSLRPLFQRSVAVNELPPAKKSGRLNFFNKLDKLKICNNSRDEDNGDFEIFVIHTAGIIDISEKGSPILYDVNVNGTKNIVSLCSEYNVKRLLYVSSVHAIPEIVGAVITEVSNFSPDTVVGAYARTKAEATEAVLEAGRKGLNVVVVQPSGIIGPYDNSGNHLVQMIGEYLKGTLPACVKGGYDFVDVRDVAKGCLLALQKGKTGNCYILSNRYYEIRDVLEMVRNFVSLKKLVVLPIWMAKIAAPFMELFAKIKHRRPLFTSYSLHTLKTKDRFSHAKATKDFGYVPRGLKETVRDTVLWFKKTTLKKLNLAPAVVPLLNNSNKKN